MPEYLAPGVYVEEIEIGAKPIEGVSTSTVGMVGMAEKGPLNKPTLVTSFADFERIFGGFLPENPWGNACFLAYAAAGFFRNGGQRLYVCRIAHTGDSNPTNNTAVASGFLPKLAEPGILPALDEKAFAQESGLKLTGTVSFTFEDTLLLKDDAQSEYLEFKGAAKKLSLKTASLAMAHAVDTKILKGAKPGSATTTIKTPVQQGTSTVELNSVDGINEGDYLLIEDSTKGNEVIVVEGITDTTITTKESIRFDHAVNIEIFKLTTSKETTLIRNTVAGVADFYVDNTTTLANNDFIIIGSEYLQIKAPVDATDVIQISPPLKYAHEKDNDLIKLVPAVEVTASSEGAWGKSIKVTVNPSRLCITELTAKASNTDHLDLKTITGIEKGSVLRLPLTTPQYVTVKETHKTPTETYVILESAFTGTLTSGDTIQTEEFDLEVTNGKNDEIFKHLSLNEKHSRYIKKIVTERSSNLIRIRDITETPPTIPMPTPGGMPGWLLNDDGRDGEPPTEADYIGADGGPNKRTGIQSFVDVDQINIIAVPGRYEQAIQNAMISHCELLKDRFAVLDPPKGADIQGIQNHRGLYDSKYAALYYPWIKVYDVLTEENILVPLSGQIAGIYARSDTERGVHKAPANEVVRGAVDVEVKISKGEQDILNPLGVDCIRPFPGRGIRVWGARTISSDTLWKYINVRRLFLFLEESIDEGTQWVVFEPNDEKLWARVRQTITQFLTRVWKDGALMGTTPEEAFFVKCDRTTMTQDDIDNGRLIVLIGVAPVKPAEFVIFRIAQWTGGSAVTE
jgi:phage tail sheath protein FI